MRLQTAIERTPVRFVALLLTGLSAWYVLKCLGWVGFYSAYAGDPRMETALAKAHLWAVSYACMAVLLATGATIAAASRFRKPVDGLAATRYILSALGVLAAIGICVVLVGVYGPAPYHDPGSARR